jgi:hypothetical protein
VGFGWILTWPFTLIFAAMLFLATEEMRRPVRETSGSIGGPNWAGQLPDRIGEVTRALDKSSVKLPVPLEEPQGSGSVRWIHRRYVMAVEPDEYERVEVALQALRAVDPGVTVTTVDKADGIEVQIGLDGLLTHTLRLRSIKTLGPPRLALVLDQLGDDLLVAREIANLDVPFAFGVRPFRPFSKEVAELARLFDREVYVDLRIADENAGDPGSLDASHDQLSQALAEVPHVVGVKVRAGRNRAWDSRLATELFAVLEKHQLSLLSDLPPPNGGESKRPTRAPIMFLGSPEDDPVRISRHLESLVAQARSNGSVVGVCPATMGLVSVLRRAVEEWRAAGIEIVRVSSLIPPPGLSAE